MAKFDRHRQAAWDAQGMRTISTRLTRHQARRLDAICAAHGITKHWLLKKFLLKVLDAGGPRTLL